jgi:hypothetical protein
MPVIGVVRSGSKRGDPFVATFSRNMSGLGWEEGRTFQLVALFADRQDERIPVLVGELVSRPVDIIVEFGDPAIQAAQRRADQVIQ